ncbi:MAG: hypothetical protein D6712_04125, partial [Chloroflexi bacterium]
MHKGRWRNFLWRLLVFYLLVSIATYYTQVPDGGVKVFILGILSAPIIGFTGFGSWWWFLMDVRHHVFNTPTRRAIKAMRQAGISQLPYGLRLMDIQHAFVPNGPFNIYDRYSIRYSVEFRLPEEFAKKRAPLNVEIHCEDRHQDEIFRTVINGEEEKGVSRKKKGARTSETVTVSARFGFSLYAAHAIYIVVDGVIVAKEWFTPQYDYQTLTHQEFLNKRKRPGFVRFKSDSQSANEIVSLIDTDDLFGDDGEEKPSRYSRSSRFGGSSRYSGSSRYGSSRYSGDDTDDNSEGGEEKPSRYGLPSRYGGSSRYSGRSRYG